MSTNRSAEHSLACPFLFHRCTSCNPKPYTHICSARPGRIYPVSNRIQSSLFVSPWNCLVRRFKRNKALEESETCCVIVVRPLLAVQLLQQQRQCQQRPRQLRLFICFCHRQHCLSLNRVFPYNKVSLNEIPLSAHAPNRHAHIRTPYA